MKARNAVYVKAVPDRFVFQRNDSLGAADAESDSKFLGDCFVDTGDLETLRDSENPKCILVGRTG